MGAKSSIEWLRGADGSEGASWNPIRAKNIDPASKSVGKVGWFCTHVNGACQFCYAETWNKSRGNGLPFKPGHRKDVEIFLDEKMLTDPLRWSRPRKVFPCSMTDIFGEFVPIDFIVRMWAVMAATPRHTYIVLTKRPERMRELTNDETFRRWVSEHNTELYGYHDYVWPLPNVMAGTSVSDQDEAAKFIPPVIEACLARRCVSIEPMLGPIDLTELWVSDDPDQSLNALGGLRAMPDGTGLVVPRLDWVICGFESGAKARFGWPDHARMIRNQCAIYEVAFHFKQWGQWGPAPAGMSYDEAVRWANNNELCQRRTEKLSSGETMVKFKKKSDAGRTLDGREWDEFPDMGAD